MNVEYRLTPEELREAQWGMMGVGMSRGKWIALFVCAGVFIAAFLLVRGWLNSGAPRPAPAATGELSFGHLAPAIPWIVGPVLLLLFLLWSRKKARSGPAFDRVHSLEADENGLVIADGVSRVEHSWAAILRPKETANLFLLYLNTNVAVPVPKRAFSDSELAEFRELLRQGNEGGKPARDAASRNGFEPLEGREHI